MQKAEVVLSVLRERGRKGLPLTQLYRQMFNKELYLLAYGNIYSNQGAMTPGASAETADGMSEEKIDQITEAMRHERYRFAPARRTYIPKKNGKLRPLGLPSWSGKLVGEVVRLLLEAYYEPGFSDLSHGFRKGRGCHTALRKWFHDGSAVGPAKTGYGNNWVIAAVIVKLPVVSRPVAVPVLAKLVIKGTSSASRLWLARRMTQMIAHALPGRPVHVVADAAYAGGELKKLPAGITWTTRLRKDAALYDLPPERTGRRGRPRVRGDRLPVLAKLAATAAFTEVTVTCYGKTAVVRAATRTCLWYSVFGSRPVQVVLIRDQSAAGHDLALVTTDLTATLAHVIERYASRWSIEVTIEDAKQVFGTGQARNRTPRAVERTVPFQLACHAIAICWYATVGHDPADVAEHWTPTGFVDTIRSGTMVYEERTGSGTGSQEVHPGI